MDILPQRRKCRLGRKMERKCREVKEKKGKGSVEPWFADVMNFSQLTSSPSMVGEQIAT